MAAIPHSCDIVSTSQEIDVSHGDGWATKEDWIRHRSTITQLYETKKLAEVMRTMESQYGFRATSVNLSI